MMAALQVAMPDSRDRETFLASMLDDSPMGLVLVSEDGHVVDANASYAKLLGYSREELAGRSVADFTHPADHARDAELFGELAAGLRDSYSIEKRYVRKNGEVRWVNVTAARLPKQGEKWMLGLAMVQDVTDRKTGEVAREHLLQRHRTAQERLELAISAGGIGGWDWDVASNTMEYSREICEIMRLRAELAPRTLEGLLGLAHPDDRDGLSQTIGTALKDPANDRFDVQVRMWCGDDTYRTLAGKGRVIRDDSLRAVRITGMAVDVTAHRAMQQKLESVRRIEAISHLAAGVAHDFNNLLMIMSGSAAILKTMVAPDSEADQLISQIEDAAAHASGITKQLMAVGRRSASNPEVLDMNGLMSRFERVMKSLIGSRATLNMVLGPYTQLVLADPAQVEQLAMNLVMNAHDAMPAGGVITLETDRAIIDDRTAHEMGVIAGEYVMLRVSDTGTGLAAEALDRVFEPFFSTRADGSGLGLAVSQGIVRQHGGYIGVTSRPGEGTVVTVYLPAVMSESPGPASTIGFEVE